MDGELKDHMVVVRFSPMSIDGVMNKAQLAKADIGHYRVSVFCRDIPEGQDVDSMLTALCAEAPAGGKRVWMTTVGRLKSAGFALYHAPPPPCHYDVDLGTELSTDVVELFVAMFDAPRRNPAWSAR